MIRFILLAFVTLSALAINGCNKEIHEANAPVAGRLAADA